MRSPQAGETSRVKWTIDVRATVLFVLACVLVVGSFALLRGGPDAAEWPLVQGDIQGTRIRADHAAETKWGSELTWKAEYRVVYFAASREYVLWADSGIRGESEAAVRLVLPQSHSTCRVKYNPKRPEDSFADCR